MKNLLTLLFALVLSVAALAQNKEGALAVTHPELKSQLNEVVEKYIDLKNALVESDSKKSKEKASTLFAVLEKVDVSKFTSPQKLYITKINSIKASAKEMAESSSLDKQREIFGNLSDQLFQLIKTAKPNHKPLYLTHCPMANDNQGANWLSEKKEIFNPYFGSHMMKCGKVMQTL